MMPRTLDILWPLALAVLALACTPACQDTSWIGIRLSDLALGGPSLAPIPSPAAAGPLSLTAVAERITSDRGIFIDGLTPRPLPSACVAERGPTCSSCSSVR